ncbi:ATP-binding cassette subfamily C protein [Rhodoligotrophos appendicifer]|uniref:ABC transporter ATP-binding protein n=1 Tax=Rhodoligotrophos appendicifer TaxID=987056 RepID=UPI00118573EB|nr:ABC transporter ATP-binding protein [Rhodoligotrophos appendicifer]
MLNVLKIFFTARGTRPGIILFCLILAGMSEAVSLGALLPTISQIGGGASEHTSALNRFVLETLLSAGITPTLGNLILVVSGALIVKAVLSFAALSYAGMSIAVVPANLRTQLLNQLMEARWSYFVNQRIGRIANAISNDATRAGDAYYVAAKFVSAIAQSSVYIIVSLLISWKLALAGLVVGLILMLSLNVLVQVSRRAGSRQTDRTSELVTYVSDAFANIKPLKSMNRQAPFSALFASKIRSLRRALIKKVFAKNGLTYGEEVLTAIMLGASVYLAADVWEIPLAELVVMGILFYQVISVTGKIQQYYQNAVELESAYWRIYELIDETAEQREPDTGTVIPTLRQAVVFDDVSFSYGERPVVEHVDLSINAGEITVLQGPSGAGKTTLMDLLIGLYHPSSGRVMIDGVSILDVRVSAWRSMIGYVPQEISLLHGSISDNITLGDKSITRAQIMRALEKAGAADFIDELPHHIDTVVGERGTKLSGGQRQRIALARALVTDPKLLILDEVTSALDPETELEICRNIQMLGGEYTIAAITHRPAWTAIATRLYQVSAGRVISLPTARVDTVPA